MIAKAGFLLQVDCPDLAMGRHTRFKERSLEEFRTAIKGNVATMSAALADIPAERIRMHLCWGNYPGPHHHDVPLQDVIDIVLTCKPKFISIEACNPGHAHEWEVFETVVWPEDKVATLGWDIYQCGQCLHRCTGIPLPVRLYTSSPNFGRSALGCIVPV